MAKERLTTPEQRTESTRRWKAELQRIPSKPVRLWPELSSSVVS
jgi:hypothetical protein